MTIMDAAKKWDLSINWIRELIKSGRVKAKLRTDIPVPYYEIPDGTPKPPSMARSPNRKGVGATITEEALKRREYRAKAKIKVKKPVARSKGSARGA